MGYVPRGRYPAQPQYGYRPRGNQPIATERKVPVRAKIGISRVLYKGRDWNVVLALLKKNKYLRERGWKMEVIGNPDDPNYKGDYIVRVKPMNGQDDGIYLKGLKIG